jgi:molybdate transport system substrate-binding protein
MGKKYLAIFLVLLVCASAYLFFYQRSIVVADPPPQKELLVYCGITMIEPMSEIARIIERQEGVHIAFIKGGSGNLLRSLKVNGVGDLFLPGSESYIAKAKSAGLVTDTVPVGFNKAAMMVYKGNPKGISADLQELRNSAYYVVIGNPQSGSIGKETRSILEAAGLYDAVQHNVREMTTDSKRLTQVLKNKEADLVVNWYATATWAGNRSFIDVLPIDERYAKKKRLVLALLKSSRYPNIARRFMEYAASEQGRAIFNRYGLYDVL